VTLISPLGSFVTYDSALNKVTFNPTIPPDIGLCTVTLSVSDALASTSHTFTILVRVLGPIYTDPTFIAYPDIDVRVNAFYDVIIPAFSAYDGSPATAQVIDNTGATMPVSATMALDYSKVTFNPISHA
jgi:hypothetical protein